MRKVLALLVVCAVAVAIPILAAEGGKAPSKTLKGEIVKWDDATKAFTVKEDSGKEIPFTWNDKTMKEGTPAVGSKVTVTYMKEGNKRIAEKIEVRVALK